MQNKIKTAVLPIAGLGTRFLPLSKIIPKEFFPLASKPVIQYIVEEAFEAGVEKIIFVISPEKREIFNKYILKYFREDKDLLKILKKRKKQEAIEALNSIPKINYDYVVQKEPRGDGDAILKAEKLVKNNPFLVLFGDDISFNGKGPLMAEQLVRTFNKVQKPVLCLYKKSKKELFAYGVPKVATKLSLRGATATKQSHVNVSIKYQPASIIYKIEDIVEKPKGNPPSNLAIVGKYLLTPDIFYYLKKTKQHNGEIILANALRAMLQGKKELYGIEAQGKWLECGTKEKWMESFLYLAKNSKN